MIPSLKEIIESMIFISPDPLSENKIIDMLSDFPDTEVKKAINDLIQFYGNNNHGIQIAKTGGGFLFTTKSETDPWIRKLLKNEQRNKLSPEALETLSVIAYHQPATLAEVSALRGVDASHSLKTLLLKRLVKITGRKKAPGKPLIYRTSAKFLVYFGLNDIKELPSQEEILKILDEEEKEIDS